MDLAPRRGVQFVGRFGFDDNLLINDHVEALSANHCAFVEHIIILTRPQSFRSPPPFFLPSRAALDEVGYRARARRAAITPRN